MDNELATKAKELRKGGLSYMNIEALLGLGDKRGFAARALCLDLKPKGAGRPPRPEPWTEGPVEVLSLWKAVDGGRSYRLVKETLGFHGIKCDRMKYETADPEKLTTKSPWEGRYEIIVPADDGDRAKALLFIELATGQEPQALDDISDPTR